MSFIFFLTGIQSKTPAASQSGNLGSIFIVNNSWIYEGGQLTLESQREIADYILNYPDEETEVIGLI